MYMIRSIIRPEKVNGVLAALLEAGFPQITKMDVFGRGKQKGIRVGSVEYDELPKEMLMITVNDDDKDEVIKIIMDNSRTGDKGTFGDGKIFVTEVEEVYTVSSGKQGL
ncbi:P-II family nitrogen regulator [Clostridium chromiireducens]|uniref:P-II family nitrogen regulator n=1 Tax=Clostridium chromiireducens TaxID=225345 RepID=A0A399IS66_9CLOT|nr:P-II family nitrogen regulator [Clostridium chromiireducens]RII34372.1 P-II family nitrogen regulator [Clostridium chromiireducens]